MNISVHDNHMGNSHDVTSLMTTRVNALSAISRTFGCARITTETRWVRSGRYLVSYITISLKYLQTDMYMNEQSVILIHLNSRVFTLRAVNSFDIFIFGNFYVFKINTHVLDHCVFMFLEILVVKSILSLKSCTFI